jgi:alpha-D-ribose 1-methylphosphonate 5-triphosphate diphosphatase
VDRGRIVQGLRADLVRIGLIDGLPITRGLWVQGKRVG